MKASNLIQELDRLVCEHGDLPVTVAIGSHEYAVVAADFARSGPLPNLGGLQIQSPPARIVLEPKDSIT